jgi:hypothetical protein
VSYGFGGAQSSAPVPLAGWAAKAQSFSVNGQRLEGYVLTSGKESIDAYVVASTDSQVAISALKAASGNSTLDLPVPASVAQHMLGYTITEHGVTFVGLQGLLQVVGLNGSRVTEPFVAVDLKQEAASFRADNGTSLYAASTSITGWAALSVGWSPYLPQILTAFQYFTQAATFVIFSAAVVILFTLARDDELSKVRIAESSSALTNSEVSVLAAFAPWKGWTTGEMVHETVVKADPEVSDSDFYAALEGVSKRGLVRSSVILRNGRPTLLWRSIL